MFCRRVTTRKKTAKTGSADPETTRKKTRTNKRMARGWQFCSFARLLGCDGAKRSSALSFGVVRRARCSATDTVVSTHCGRRSKDRDRGKDRDKDKEKGKDRDRDREKKHRDREDKEGRDKEKDKDRDRERRRVSTLLRRLQVH